MKSEKRVSNFLCTSLFIFLVIISFSQRGYCYLAGASIESINPPVPMELTPFEITMIVVNAYPSTVMFEYDNSTVNVNGTSIEMDYYFFDSYPSEIRVDLPDVQYLNYSFSLPAGDYSVTSNVWVTEDWEFPIYYLDDSSVGYFTVVPEPATMVLLSLGGLLLRRKK